MVTSRCYDHRSGPEADDALRCVARGREEATQPIESGPSRVAVKTPDTERVATTAIGCTTTIRRSLTHRFSSAAAELGVIAVTNKASYPGVMYSLALSRAAWLGGS